MYCLVTVAHGYEQLAEGFCTAVPKWESNLQSLRHSTRSATISLRLMNTVHSQLH